MKFNSSMVAGKWCFTSYDVCRGGDWRTGGNCHLETLPDLSPQLSLNAWSHFLTPFRNLPTQNSTATGTLELDLLNVTEMTARRKDGHLSVFYLGPSGPSPLHKQDCSHWCLPGVPDAWNELLYALFMKRESMRDQNLTVTGNTRVILSY